MSDTVSKDLFADTSGINWDQTGVLLTLVVLDDGNMRPKTGDSNGKYHLTLYTGKTNVIYSNTNFPIGWVVAHRNSLAQ